MVTIRSSNLWEAEGNDPIKDVKAAMKEIRNNAGYCEESSYEHLIHYIMERLAKIKSEDNS